MRLRVKNAPEQTRSASRRSYCCYNGSAPQCPVSDTEVSWTSYSQRDAMLDIVTPDFHAIKAAGGLVFSPVWRETITAVMGCALFDCEVANGGVFYCYDGYTAYPDHTSGGTTPMLTTAAMPQAIDTYLAEFESERDLALTQAWANVDQSEMLALASMGELPETIRWIADIYRRLIKVFALFRARRVKLALKRQLMSPVKFADAMLNFWMELRYAVRPLCFEMEQVVNALNAGTLPARQTARGHHNVNEQVSTDSGSELLYDWESTLTRSSNYRAGVLYQIQQAAANWTHIIGLDQPLESIWELTKLSFALDWVVNVGDLISSHSVSAALTPLGSWITEDHTFVEDVKILNHGRKWPPPYSDRNINVHSSGDHSVMRRLVRRHISPDKPVFPHITVNLDMLKIVDLVAITRSIYRGLYS